MKRMLLHSVILSLFFAVIPGCKKEEVPTVTTPQIEDYTISFNNSILNNPDYFAYIISDQYGHIHDYKVTEGQTFQEDLVYKMEKSSDIQIAVTFISKTPYYNDPNHARVDLTTFMDLPNEAHVDYIKKYYFSWTSAIKTLQITGIEQLNDIKFSNLSTSIDIEDVSLSGNTLIFSVSLPNSYESIVLIKANGENEYRYTTFLTGETSGSYTYNEMPVVEKKEILMPKLQDWSGYIFGENETTGKKMSLYGQTANGQTNDQFFMVYYPGDITFSSFDFYLKSVFTYATDVEIFETYHLLPNSIDLKDQLSFVENNFNPERILARPTTSSDIFLARYQHIGYSDIHWDIVGESSRGIIDFTLPVIPDEIETKYPNDLIFNRNIEYAYVHLINIQKPLPQNFWRNPSVSLDFDWLIKNGAYSVNNYINF